MKEKKKSTEKKTATKAASPKKPAVKKLVTAKPENYFILVTGVPLKDLRELANSFETMDDWVFYHHVNDARNDFANWASEILLEAELAEDMKNIKHPREMERKVLKHIINKYL